MFRFILIPKTNEEKRTLRVRNCAEINSNSLNAIFAIGKDPRPSSVHNPETIQVFRRTELPQEKGYREGVLPEG
ncbi:hypothetical protein Cflav_PD6050 [Pedosphaera parvula Ellin514]|uniref:Uncharacterized protein n=1 Tax=Pedosphaera parvula (strain Ellin514) TaxID=320771 RepID=B9XA74_PEDPL|nr:hypothetical protein Cflav_PD6050 [Pedosphaera parvula Ellin514]